MKIAIIGLGVIGSVHADVLKETGEEVVALCDTVAERAEKVGREFFPEAKIFVDYQRMLEEIKPDAVHVCTPHYLHAPMTVACLQRDIHVLCEKPLCINSRQLEEILSAEKKSNATLGVCLQNRYALANRTAKKYLEEHPAKTGFGYMVWHRDMAYYDSEEWRGQRATEGGGALINQALHTLDLMQWFLGLPDTCTATVQNLILKGIEVEDTVACHFEGERGFTFFATTGSAWDYPVEINLKVDEGMLQVTPDGVWLNGKILAYAQATKVLGKGCYGTGHEDLIVDFYRCLKEGRKFSIDGAEGAKVMRLIFAVYASKQEKINVDRGQV